LCTNSYCNCSNIVSSVAVPHNNNNNKNRNNNIINHEHRHHHRHHHCNCHNNNSKSHHHHHHKIIYVYGNGNYQTNNNNINSNNGVNNNINNNYNNGSNHYHNNINTNVNKNINNNFSNNINNNNSYSDMISREYYSLQHYHHNNHSHLYPAVFEERNIGNNNSNVNAITVNSNLKKVNNRAADELTNPIYGNYNNHIPLLPDSSNPQTSCLFPSVQNMSSSITLLDKKKPQYSNISVQNHPMNLLSASSNNNNNINNNVYVQENNVLSGFGTDNKIPNPYLNSSSLLSSPTNCSCKDNFISPTCLFSPRSLINYNPNTIIPNNGKTMIQNSNTANPFFSSPSASSSTNNNFSCVSHPHPNPSVRNNLSMVSSNPVISPAVSDFSPLKPHNTLSPFGNRSSIPQYTNIQTGNLNYSSTSPYNANISSIPLNSSNFFKIQNQESVTSNSSPSVRPCFTSPFSISPMPPLAKSHHSKPLSNNYCNNVNRNGSVCNRNFNSLRTPDDVNENNPYSSFIEVKGSMMELLSTQNGSRFMQKVLDSVNDHENRTSSNSDNTVTKLHTLSSVLDSLLDEVLPFFSKLAVDQFCNFLCSKIISYSSTSHLVLITNTLSDSLYKLHQNKLGNHVVQCLLEKVKDNEEIHKVIIKSLNENIIEFLNTKRNSLKFGESTANIEKPSNLIGSDEDNFLAILSIIFCSWPSSSVEFIYSSVYEYMDVYCKLSNSFSLLQKCVSSPHTTVSRKEKIIIAVTPFAEFCVCFLLYSQLSIMIRLLILWVIILFNKF
jgi:hypothetical protein